MLDLIEAYIEQSPFEQNIKRALKDTHDAVVMMFDGKVIGTSQSVDYSWAEEHTPVDSLRRYGISTLNPCAELMHTSSGSMLSENIEREIQRATQSYIGRPYDAETVASMEYNIQNILGSYGHEGVVDIGQDSAGEISVSVGINDTQRSPVTNGSSVNTQLHMERPEYAETGFIPVDLTETYEDNLDDQERAYMATQEYVQRTRPVYIKNEEGKDLIDAYNERYKPDTRPKIRIAREVDLHVNDDAFERFQREVSASIARAMDQRVMESLGLIGEEPQPLPDITLEETYRTTVYSEEMLRAMPLELTEVLPYSVSIDREIVPMYAGAGRAPVYMRRSAHDTVQAGFWDIVGLLSTGQYMARKVYCDKDNTFVRMGRDGQLYDYSSAHKTARLLDDQGESQTTNWHIESIKEEDRWFRMDISNLSTGNPSIVDIN